jgi:hypothetical protein
VSRDVVAPAVDGARVDYVSASGQNRGVVLAGGGSHPGWLRLCFGTQSRDVVIEVVVCPAATELRSASSGIVIAGGGTVFSAAASLLRSRKQRRSRRGWWVLFGYVCASEWGAES